VLRSSSLDDRPKAKATRDLSRDDSPHKSQARSKAAAAAGGDDDGEGDGVARVCAAAPRWRAATGTTSCHLASTLLQQLAPAAVASLDRGRLRLCGVKLWLTRPKVGADGVDGVTRAAASVVGQA